MVQRKEIHVIDAFLGHPLHRGPPCCLLFLPFLLAYQILLGLFLSSDFFLSEKGLEGVPVG